MIATLLQRLMPLSWLAFLVLVLGVAQPARATHLLGGEMTYRYLDANGTATSAPHRYEITLTVYNSCGATAIRPNAVIGIYNQGTGAKVVLTATNYPTLNNGSMSVAQTSLDACTTPYVPPGCTIVGASQSYQLQKFIGIVSLPASTNGYYALWTDGNRNAGITNISNPSDYEYMTLYSTLAPPSRPNSSPVFVDKAVANLCVNDTTYLLNNATDADGDRLEYSLAQPYGNLSTTPPTSFLPAPALVPYAAAQYTATTPLGTAAGNYASINLNTGIAKYRTTAALGNKYVVAIDVKEYRTINGQQVLIGVTRRDLQMVVVSCPNTVPPVLPTATATTPVPRNYTLEVGNTLTIPLTATQANNNPLTMSLSSVLLDGAGGFNATFGGSPGTLAPGNPAGTASVASTSGPVSGTFVYTAGCNDARATPYDVTLTVKDEGCAGKTVGDVLRITVVKPTGPTNITGPLSVCGLGTVQSYTASGGTAPGVSWTVTGGTIVGSSTANPVQVRWPAAGPGTIAAQGITQYGCPTDLVTRSVVVSPIPVLTVTGNLTICQGSSTTLTVTGGFSPYLVVGGAAPVTGAGPFVLSPTQTTTYTITPLVLPANGCPATAQVTITVNPRPAATAGAPVTICPGGTAQLGAAPVAGSTYSWSPATGLSSSTVANPTVTLPNTTSFPITQTYTLTETTTSSTCQTSNTVTVTVAPPPVAAPGAAVTICSGGIGQLGAAPVAGTTYSWSPATGLSSSTIANPSVTLTNTTGAPITQTYTLTVTTGANCTNMGTVVVTVSPPPVATPGAPITICSGSAGQLGAAPVAGLTYSWSPVTGLSSSTVANPTVTLTNTTSTAITQLYTLTVTTAAGCPATSTVAVTVSPQLVVNAGAPVTICSGGTGQLGGAPVAGSTYSWSPTTGLSNASIANPTVTLTNTTGAPITQTYTLTLTTAANCSSTGTVVVTVSPPPVANAGAPITICSGSTGPLGAAPAAGLSYSWSPAAGLSSTTVANPTVTLTNTTGAPITQTYTLTVSTAANCLSTGTVVVTVSPLPVATAGATVAFCSGGSAQLGAAAVAGLTYSWSPATGLSSATAADPTVTLTNTTGGPITQTYTLTVTSTATGCQQTAPVVVTVNPLPVANAGPAVAICSGGAGQLGAAAVAGLSYSWSPATGLSSSTVANPGISLTNTTGAPITQTYTLTATNTATSCVNTGTVVVTVNPLPVAAPGSAITICSGGVGQVGGAPVAGLTYSWSPATGLSSSTVANPTVTLTNPTTTATTQVYTLTVTSLGTTCASTGTVAVTVNPAVLPGAIGADQTVCAGAVPAPLTSTAAASGGLGAYDYQWESSPDNVTWKAIANSTTLSYAPSAVAATTYYRRRVLAGTCGLAYTNVVTVQAQQLLLPTVALPTLPAQCAGLALTFTPAPANAGAAPTYRWFINGTQVATGPTYTSSTLADGDVVQVELTPTVGFCATGTAIAATRVSLTAVPLPTLTLVLKTALPVCVGAPISISLDRATNVGANPQYQWQVDGVNVSGATTTNFTSTTLRDGQAVTLVVRTTDACGQAATATSGVVRVAVNPPVHVSAGPDKTITEGESVTLEGTADGSYPVTWTPSATLTVAAGGDPLRPLATPLATTTYTLSAGAGYCADQSSVTVTVLRRVRIPNAFTPNADNNDDTWQIANIEEYPGNHVLVFNRWGQKVFEASGYSRSNEWNGTSNGQELPFATYYYVITLGNGKSFTGPLTVVR